MLFIGPDPPLERNEPDPEAMEALAKEQAAAKKKGPADEAPAEIPKDPQEEIEDAMYESFTQSLVSKVSDIAFDLSKYRQMLHPETGIKKIALFPRVLTEQ